MGVMAAVVGLVLAISVLVLALARVHVVHIARDSIQGSDLHMLKWAVQEDTRCWMGFHLELAPTADFDAAVDELRARIARDLQRPDSNFRRSVDRHRRAYLFDASLTVDDLIEDVGSDQALLTLSDPRDRPLIFRISRARRWVGVLFDHTVWDGIGAFQELLVPALGTAPFDEHRLLEEGYRPVLSELLQLYTLGAFVARGMLTRTALPTLADGQQQRVFVHRVAVAHIRTIRDGAQTSFVLALLSHWAHTVHQASPAHRRPLRVGVVVGVKNPRFRNNYSALTLDVPRLESPVAIARALHQQARWRQVEVRPTYQFFSYLELQTAFKSSALDALFSPVVFEPGEGPSLLVQGMSLYNIPCSTPLYAFTCSTSGTVTLSTTWNTEAVDPDVFGADAVTEFRQPSRGVLEVYRRQPKPPAGESAL